MEREQIDAVIAEAREECDDKTLGGDELSEREINNYYFDAESCLSNKDQLISKYSAKEKYGDLCADVEEES